MQEQDSTELEMDGEIAARMEVSSPDGGRGSYQIFVRSKQFTQINIDKKLKGGG